MLAIVLRFSSKVCSVLVSSLSYVGANPKAAAHVAVDLQCWSLEYNFAQA